MPNADEPVTPVTPDIAEPPQLVNHVRPRRGRLRTLVAVLLVVAGLTAMGVGGVTVAQTLNRKPSADEVAAAAVTEQRNRWRTLTAEEVFPAEVPYVDKESWDDSRPHLRATRKATRVGIAPPASCAAALDKKAADALAGFGCHKVLRATYVDDTQTMVTTVGVVVFSRGETLSGAIDAEFTRVLGDTAKEDYGLRTVPFPGTVAAGFTDGHRQDLWLEGHDGPYLFLRSSGWTDSRPYITSEWHSESFPFAQRLLERLQDTFARSAGPCVSRRIEC